MKPQEPIDITTARQMGVNVKMVTGDQLGISRETARKMGLGTVRLGLCVGVVPRE